MGPTKTTMKAVDIAEPIREQTAKTIKLGRSTGARSRASRNQRITMNNTV